MEIDTYFIEQEEIRFNTFINDNKNLAMVAESDLSSEFFTKVEELAVENNCETFLLYPMIKFSKQLMFFPNANVLKKFREYGLYSKDFIRWFIPIETLITKFNEINNSGEIYISKYGSILYIQQFIESKMIVELQNVFGFKLIENYDGRTKLTAASKQILLFNERVKERKGDKDYIKYWEQPISEVFNSIEKTDKADETKLFFLDYYEGKTEKWFLTAMLHNCVLKKNNQISNRKRNILLFDLINLLCADTNYKTKKEYNDSDENEYGGKYSNYKSSIVQNLFDKWSSKTKI